MVFSLSNFYQSKQWVSFRNIIVGARLNDEGFVICTHCGKPIIKAYDIIAHHIIPLTEDNVNDYAISLNPDNIQLVHHVCHNHIHNKLGYKYKKAYIIYGAPFSGKHAYVSNILNDGDLIISMDNIWQCISGMDRYNHDGRLNAIAFAMRDKMIECIKYRIGKWNTAFIVGGYPLIGERERLSKELGAEIVLIESKKDECLARLNDYQGIIDKRAYKKFIDEWFEKNIPPH